MKDKIKPQTTKRSRNAREYYVQYIIGEYYLVK